MRVQHEQANLAQKLAQTDDRGGFKCSSCKRTLMYDAKYQCIVCPEVSICKLCFGASYHDKHEFLMRP